ncbi:MAG: DUF2238 domain-containing protein [Nanoarchaeota archaeon]|nr:DUF2238 domain-containing protein [Nanoarchaeota archaeon]
MNLRNVYPKILFVIYILVWIWGAINPRYRSVWVDENILVVVFVGVLLISYRKIRLSNLSYSLIFIFMVLHTIGGHYSYAEMPLFDWIKDNYQLERNHYDRVVHFLFGVLMFYPVYEILNRIFLIPKGWRGLFIAFFIISAFKGIFESIEYGYVALRNNSLTVSNYLGEQGDSLDAIKDISLGIFGAVVSWIVVGLGIKLKKI